MSFCNKSLETDLNEEAKRANTRTVWMNTDSSQASILTDISFISSRDWSWTFFAFLIDWLTQNFNWFGAIIQYNTWAEQLIRQVWDIFLNKYLTSSWGKCHLSLFGNVLFCSKRHLRLVQSTTWLYFNPIPVRVENIQFLVYRMFFSGTSKYPENFGARGLRFITLK